MNDEASPQAEELNEKNDVQEEPPPILKSWKNIYWLVFGNLIFWIALFTLFTWMFK
jgi:hypothetical protein